MPYEIHDAVRPIKKSVLSPLTRSVQWRRAVKKGQKHLYVVAIYPRSILYNIMSREELEQAGVTADTLIYKCTVKNGDIYGDFFAEFDLVPAFSSNNEDFLSLLPTITED